MYLRYPADRIRVRWVLWYWLGAYVRGEPADSRVVSCLIELASLGAFAVGSLGGAFAGLKPAALAGKAALAAL